MSGRENAGGGLPRPGGTWLENAKEIAGFWDVAVQKKYKSWMMARSSIENIHQSNTFSKVCGVRVIAYFSLFFLSHGQLRSWWLGGLWFRQPTVVSVHNIVFKLQCSLRQHPRRQHESFLLLARPTQLPLTWLELELLSTSGIRWVTTAAAQWRFGARFVPSDVRGWRLSNAHILLRWERVELFVISTKKHSRMKIFTLRKKYWMKYRQKCV